MVGHEFSTLVSNTKPRCHLALAWLRIGVSTSTALQSTRTDLVTDLRTARTWGLERVFNPQVGNMVPFAIGLEAITISKKLLGWRGPIERPPSLCSLNTPLFEHTVLDGPALYCPSDARSLSSHRSTLDARACTRLVTEAAYYHFKESLFGAGCHTQKPGILQTEPGRTRSPVERGACAATGRIAGNGFRVSRPAGAKPFCHIFLGGLISI